MEDGELLCNFKKCRKILIETAYITRCSHAFCEDHGKREILNEATNKKCPACQLPLVDGYDFVKVALNPCEGFKSVGICLADLKHWIPDRMQSIIFLPQMILAGLRPECIMDIAMRAIMFWNFQQHQQYLHEKLVSKTLKNALRHINPKAQYRLFKSKHKKFRRKICELEKKLEKQTKKCLELSEKLVEKCGGDSFKWPMIDEHIPKELHCEFGPQLKNDAAANRENEIINLGP